MSNKSKKGIPQLRFSEFSESLQLIKYLGEMLDFKNGINADKSQYGQGIKFINV
jgi:type I restriction enzyme S subunit